MNYQFTSESVSEGHPDKVADQISDAILDAYLAQDPLSRVACECLITTQHLVIAGEVRSKASVDAVEIAKKVIAGIGYDDEAIGFDFKTAKIENLLHGQSREISESVVTGGAGDQGLMFGYACNETSELMPLPILIAHRLVERQSQLRKQGIIPWLLPDAKSQVTVNYENDVPVSVNTIVLSTQHRTGIEQEKIREVVTQEIIRPITEQYLPGGDFKILVNPSGSFTVGGPHGDTGLTGRKIIVDTYGGSCPHGGGAFSGKDSSKVDRSAAYGARYVAKHIVAAGLAGRCTVQLSYAIGVAEPTSVYVNTHDTGDSSRIAKKIQNLFDLTPQGIVKTLKLNRPIYLETAAYGHFGKNSLPWEQIDQDILEELQND